MYNWSYVLLVVGIFQPISSVTSQNLLNRQNDCCDTREPVRERFFSKNLHTNSGQHWLHRTAEENWKVYGKTHESRVQVARAPIIRIRDIRTHELRANRDTEVLSRQQRYQRDSNDINLERRNSHVSAITRARINLQSRSRDDIRKYDNLRLSKSTYDEVHNLQNRIPDVKARQITNKDFRHEMSRVSTDRISSRISREDNRNMKARVSDERANRRALNTRERDSNLQNRISRVRVEPDHTLENRIRSTHNRATLGREQNFNEGRNIRQSHRDVIIRQIRIAAPNDRDSLAQSTRKLESDNSRHRRSLRERSTSRYSRNTKDLPENRVRISVSEPTRIYSTLRNLPRQSRTLRTRILKETPSEKEKRVELKVTSQRARIQKVAVRNIFEHISNRIRDDNTEVTRNQRSVERSSLGLRMKDSFRIVPKGKPKAVFLQNNILNDVIQNTADNWVNYALYLLQGIYLCGALKEILGKNIAYSKKRVHGWLPLPTEHMKVE